MLRDGPRHPGPRVHVRPSCSLPGLFRRRGRSKWDRMCKTRPFHAVAPCCLGPSLFLLSWINEESCPLPAVPPPPVQQRHAEVRARLSYGGTFISCSEEALDGQRCEAVAVLKELMGRCCQRFPGLTGNVIVVREAVPRRMTDIEGDEGCVAIVLHAYGDRMEGEDVEQQRDEYEKAELSHSRYYRLRRSILSSETTKHEHARLLNKQKRAAA